MANEIKNQWVAYELIGRVCVGRIVAEYPAFVDIQSAQSKRHPETYAKTDVRGRFASPREAIDCACKHGCNGVELEKFFRESFESVKLDPAE